MSGPGGKKEGKEGEESIKRRNVGKQEEDGVGSRRRRGGGSRRRRWGNYVFWTTERHSS